LEQKARCWLFDSARFFPRTGMRRNSEEHLQ